MRLACVVLQLVLVSNTLCDVQTSSQPDEFTEQAESLVRSLTMPEARRKDIPVVLKHLGMAFNTRWPGSRVFVFGSTVSGVAAPDSDVDCYVQLPSPAHPSDVIEQAKITLEKFPILFKDFRIKPIARVPLISFTHVPTEFHVDVNFNGIDGVRNSQLFRYLINSDKRVLYLCIIVKYWAKLHEITGSKRMPSYGMITLVIFYLQQINILPPVNWMQRYAKPHFVENWNVEFDELAFVSRNTVSLYDLLGGFFEYYNSFDFEENVVSPFVGHPVPRRLFDDWRSLEEFDLYRKNIAANITLPFDQARACIQDVFYHNKNLAAELDMSPSSVFVTQFQKAASAYRDRNRSDFLHEILTM